MSKFKVGDVVKYKYDGIKGVSINRNEIACYSGWTDDSSYEYKATKEAPYKVVRAWRKNKEGIKDYQFFMAKRGRKLFIVAGCRFFTSIKAAKKHWTDRDYSSFLSRYRYYDGTTDALDAAFENRKFLDQSSLKIIDNLYAKLKKMGA